MSTACAVSTRRPDQGPGDVVPTAQAPKETQGLWDLVSALLGREALSWGSTRGSAEWLCAGRQWPVLWAPSGTLVLLRLSVGTRELLRGGLGLVLGPLPP